MFYYILLPLLLRGGLNGPVGQVLAGPLFGTTRDSLLTDSVKGHLMRTRLTLAKANLYQQ